MLCRRRKRRPSIKQAGSIPATSCIIRSVLYNIIRIDFGCADPSYHIAMSDIPLLIMRAEVWFRAVRTTCLNASQCEPPIHTMVIHRYPSLVIYWREYSCSREYMCTITGWGSGNYKYSNSFNINLWGMSWIDHMSFQRWCEYLAVQSKNCLFFK